jgi:hypothetical protein
MALLHYDCQFSPESSPPWRLCYRVFVDPGSSSPQRQRGGSPVSQHTPISRTARTTTNEMYAANALLGGNRNTPATKSAKKTASTIQPCHTGRPHPHPYRFAGNQYSVFGCNGASFREKVAIHGIIAAFYRRGRSQLRNIAIMGATGTNRGHRKHRHNASMEDNQRKRNHN